MPNKSQITVNSTIGHTSAGRVVQSMNWVGCVLSFCCNDSLSRPSGMDAGKPSIHATGLRSTLPWTLWGCSTGSRLLLQNLVYHLAPEAPLKEMPMEPKEFLELQRVSGLLSSARLPREKALCHAVAWWDAKQITVKNTPKVIYISWRTVFSPA